jgi:DNA-binding PadR family transcriptional regulator
MHLFLDNVLGGVMLKGDRSTCFFEKGDMKYVILAYLKKGSAHGYEIIHSIEDKYHGFYSPSPGCIYPTLQILEDLGYVKSSKEDLKKIYTITEAGINALETRGEVKSKLKVHPELLECTVNHEFLKEAFKELRDVIKLVGRCDKNVDAYKLDRIRSIIFKTCEDVKKILAEK